MRPIECAYFQAMKALLLAHLGDQMPAAYFDPRGDRCFCAACLRARGDGELYQRGQPSRPYLVPVGWARVGLFVSPGLVEMHNPFRKWNNAYHGTSWEKMLKIFNSGLHLLRAGDVAMGGEKIGIGKSKHPPSCAYSFLGSKIYD